MRKTSGFFEIFDSGTIISFRNESIIFYLTDDLKITLSFINDPSNQSQKMNPRPINNKEMILELTNFNNSLGTGTTEPLKLGTLNNRVLYLNFVVYSLGINSQKTFNYTWYLGEEVKNG